MSVAWISQGTFHDKEQKTQFTMAEATRRFVALRHGTTVSLLFSWLLCFLSVTFILRLVVIVVIPGFPRRQDSLYIYIYIYRRQDSLQKKEKAPTFAKKSKETFPEFHPPPLYFFLHFIGQDMVMNFTCSSGTLGKGKFN